jgi:hypothetical protein
VDVRQIVLHQLDGLAGHAALADLVTIALEHVLCSLAEAPLAACVHGAAEAVGALAKSARPWTSTGGVRAPTRAEVDAWCERLRAIEDALACVGSLTQKLPGQPALARALLASPTHEAAASEAMRRSMGTALLRAAQRPLLGSDAATPEPEAREYVLRCCVPRPHGTSTPTAQRMYVGLRPDQCRVAIALSVDTEC